MFDSSMYPFHPKLSGVTPCLCLLHHASCTGVTPHAHLRVIYRCYFGRIRKVLAVKHVEGSGESVRSEPPFSDFAARVAWPGGQPPTDGGGGVVAEYKLLEEEDVTYEK
ncbi:hypothetical protein LR48_Vigan03g076100 [Vigna angularis]|uniref:Uncharacterized protein n=1 Tax=Phaseolus angularis TaxID=3914 RepID=A0A0L9U4Q3_PHAAN|nr:hypothetical protein LR48_Vigan03g076100 [Vigna angularis]